MYYFDIEQETEEPCWQFGHAFYTHYDVDAHFGLDENHEVSHKIREFRKLGFHAKPVSKYEHGGIKYSLGFERGWDTCCIGFILISYDDIRKAYDIQPKNGKYHVSPHIWKQIDADMRKELEHLNFWVNGMMFSQHVVDENLEYVDGCGEVTYYDEGLLSRYNVHYAIDTEAARMLLPSTFKFVSRMDAKAGLLQEV